VSATIASEAIVRAAAIELAAAVVLLDRVAELADDWASPGYKPDAQEREQMRKALEASCEWRHRHAQLLTWAKRTGQRPAAKIIGVIT
jgi:hypothetical protein